MTVKVAVTAKTMQVRGPRMMMMPCDDWQLLRSKMVHEVPTQPHPLSVSGKKSAEELEEQGHGWRRRRHQRTRKRKTVKKKERWRPSPPCVSLLHAAWIAAEESTEPPWFRQRQHASAWRKSRR